VLEEFIPLRKEASDGNTQRTDTSNNKADEVDAAKDKKNWMSSVQLWSGDNQNQAQTLVSESKSRKVRKQTSFNCRIQFLI